MKIRLVSHASVIVEGADLSLWTDPWLFGKAFNESWTLAPPPAWDESWLNAIDFLWISHEHPDHFHVPTLKALPDSFKRRVTVLFQKNNSDKMPRALAGLGFRNVKLLPHRATVSLTPLTSVYCYHEGQMNSCLAIMGGGQTVLNVNDAEIRGPDCRLITKDIGPVDLVLNQFSIAGYSGLPDREARLRRMAEQILRTISDNHRDLRAKVTVPFASFIYFSTTDNGYVNAFANRPADVAEYFSAQHQQAVILYPGDTYELGQPYDSTAALSRFENYERNLLRYQYEQTPSVPWSEIKRAFDDLAKHLHARYPAVIFFLLRPFNVHIPDLGITARFSIKDSSVVELDGSNAAQLEVNSQPLSFAFRYPYGVQTLGVSARAQLKAGIRNWQMHRVLFAMNNAEVYLKPRYLFRRENREYFARRAVGGSSNLMRRVRSMMA